MPNARDGTDALLRVKRLHVLTVLGEYQTKLTGAAYGLIHQ